MLKFAAGIDTTSIPRELKERSDLLEFRWIPLLTEAAVMITSDHESFSVALMEQDSINGYRIRPNRTKRRSRPCQTQINLVHINNVQIQASHLHTYRARMLVCVN